MGWLTRTQYVKSVECQSRLVRLAFGAIGLCCAFSIFANSALADSIMADTTFAGNIAELDALSEIGAHIDVITDIDLSAITGKGAEATKLESNDKFAVLLWDERGNGNRRATGHDMDSSQSFQAVNLTVNRK